MPNMEQLIADFSKQLKEAIEIGRSANVSPSTNEIRNVVCTGLGGSGIGGSLAYEFVGNELKVPLSANKDYFLPHYVNEHTLVICSSYSGNTEETLAAFQEALEAKANIVCVSSGGSLIELAKEHNLDYIILPGGNPPRAMLAYSLVQQFYILQAYNLIGGTFEKELLSAIALLNKEEEHIQSQASEIASQLQDTVPVIYVDNSMDAVGVRFRQQINENSKMLSWSGPVPEMNHNELVGWRNEVAPWVPIFLRNKADYKRNQQRIEINKEIVSKYSKKVLEIWSKGDNHTERALYLIHLTDWVSLYLGELNGVDVVEVKVIDFLKSSLAKQNA